MRRQRITSYAIVCSRNKIALSQNGRGPYQNQWHLPGGGIDFGEDPWQGLCRELKEELP